MKHIAYIILAASLAAGLCACQKEKLDGNGSPSASLSFSPAITGGGVSNGDTKAMDIKSLDETVSLPLVFSSKNGIDMAVLSDGSEATKGTQYNTLSAFQSEVGAFTVTAYNSDGSKYLNNAAVTYSDGGWALGFSAPAWLDSDEKTFFASANLPTTGATVSCSNEAHTFSYSVKDNAAAQNDILLGYYKGDGDSKGVAKITFVHPLTAVVLKLGEVPENVTSVKSVTLEGVYKSGTAEISYAYSDGGVLVPSCDWGTSRSETMTVSQSVNVSTPNEGAVIGEPFIFLPQDLAVQSVIVRVMLGTDSGDKEVSAVLNADNWKEGTTNRYELGYDYHTYEYEFSVLPKDEVKEFSNTDSDQTIPVAITSTRIDEDGFEYDVDWKISSYQVGENEPVKVNGLSISDIGGYSAENTSGCLMLTSIKNPLLNIGSHEYWVNSDKRTDNLDWSPADWSNKGTIDLSTYDYETDKPNAHLMTTANTYIVRHAGTYRIPIVYGNGIKDGKFNPESYNNKLNNRDYDVFVNHLGHAIYSPIISENTLNGTLIADENEYIIPTSYSKKKFDRYRDNKLVDTINDDIIEIKGITLRNVKIDGNYHSIYYLEFTVPEEKVKQGFSVIQVNDQNNKCLWIWNIWITNNPYVAQPGIMVKSYQNKTYEVTQYCTLGENQYLGCIPRKQVVLNLKQNFSNKDLSIRLLSDKNIDYSLFYTYKISPYYSSDLSDKDDNPYCSINLSKCGYINPIVDDIVINSKKTILDPSPVGFIVPPIDLFVTAVRGRNIKIKKDVADIDLNASKTLKTGLYMYTVPDNMEKNNPVMFIPIGKYATRSQYRYERVNMGSAYVDGYIMCFEVNSLHILYGESSGVNFIRPVREW